MRKVTLKNKMLVTIVMHCVEKKKSQEIFSVSTSTSSFLFLIVSMSGKWCHRAAAFNTSLQFHGSFATIDCH